MPAAPAASTPCSNAVIPSVLRCARRSGARCAQRSAPAGARRMTSPRRSPRSVAPCGPIVGWRVWRPASLIPSSWIANAGSTKPGAVGGRSGSRTSRVLTAVNPSRSISPGNSRRCRRSAPSKRWSANSPRGISGCTPGTRPCNVTGNAVRMISWIGAGWRRCWTSVCNFACWPAGLFRVSLPRPRRMTSPRGRTCSGLTAPHRLRRLPLPPRRPRLCRRSTILRFPRPRAQPSRLRPRVLRPRRVVMPGAVTPGNCVRLATKSARIGKTNDAAKFIDSRIQPDFLKVPP